MIANNLEVAKALYQLADLLELEDENPFRVRAYRNAARTIEGLTHSVADMVARDEDLTELPGIGEAIAEKIVTFVKTGKFPQLEAEEKRIPKILSQLMRLPGLGPKRIKKLHEKFHINSIADLAHVAEEGKIQKLPGFGVRTEEQIKQGLIHFAAAGKRMNLANAEAIAKPLLASILKIKGVKTAEIAGSYRRRQNTVGDLDILVITNDGNAVINQFVKNENVAEIVSQGPTRAIVKLYSGLQVDMRAVPQESYGSAMLYFTGSKAHNIALRQIAVKKKIKINEYGVYKGKKYIAGKTEKEVYKQIGLPYIEPELREDRGEIEAVKGNGSLPILITLDAIQGDLHCHTHATDGQDSLVDMVQAAKQLGYKYIAITDHTKHLTVAKGLDKKRLLQQIKAIDKLNAKLRGITVLKSSEVDILEDGALDLPNDVLKELDLTVCSIHSKFNLSFTKQTERIIRAMDNPYFNIFGHPTGRLINRRQAYDLDLEKIMLAAKQRGCFLEINAQPERMDLNDVHIHMAKEIGIKMAISTDSHSIMQLENMRFGVDQARRGWLTAKEVINTYKLHDLRRLLKR